MWETWPNPRSWEDVGWNDNGVREAVRCVSVSLADRTDRAERRADQREGRAEQSQAGRKRPVTKQSKRSKANGSDVTKKSALPLL